MARADYHTHTSLCKHAEGNPFDYLKQALIVGLDEYGIADHSPFPALNDGCRMEPEEWPLYLKIVDSLREKAGKKIQIRLGIELDWIPDQMDEVYKLLNKESFDYVIGSVHYIDGFEFDHPRYREQLRDPELADSVWNRYMNALRELIESGCADIIGHVDLPKKFGCFASKKVMESVHDGMNELFKTAARKGMALDLNTSGWRREIRECYPSATLLKLAAQSGIGLTLGSDAHAPQEIGFNFDEAVNLAKTCGFKELTLYEKRHPKRVPLV